MNTNTSGSGYLLENPRFYEKSYVDKENMQVKGPGSDALRVSISSVPSTSSHGSAPDDSDGIGDVYIWGEIISDNSEKAPRTDVLLPRPLESNVVFDVQSLACGVKHAAIVTKQGEIFTWGDESGGCLGHWIGKDVSNPRLVEHLSICNVSSAACGEFHTCAVTSAGELYTWGDGTHNVGLLGHDTNISHWIPRRISGILEGLHVSMVTCGPWHTALLTNTGQLFTFGDGTFGVLGHGDRKNVMHPREVESLAGLKTIYVACGVWHTAAVVEVIVSQSSGLSGKLFTWGDGDCNRLGHGDNKFRLEPTCVSPLIEYDFQKVSCGHSLTVCLTTSGEVFTMGASLYGQLGIPLSNGKLPRLVEDKLMGECVEEIACGAYHVACLTSANEVYTWGKGANGRLGHGDIEDRKTPAIVEALKDRYVKHIACGANYTAATCLHKLVSGSETSQCSACRQAFGFTRKKHNCYNCGLVHCHSCSSKKSLRAALAPSLSKRYRVCDSCYTKLGRVPEVNDNPNPKKTFTKRLENKAKSEKPSELRISNLDYINQLDGKIGKQGTKGDAFFLIGPSQTPLTVDLQQYITKPVLSSCRVASRTVSPFSRRSSPPRSATPAGVSFDRSATDRQKRTNGLLNQEVNHLRTLVESLRQRCRHQESELQKSANRIEEAITLATEETAKCKAAKEVVKSLVAQLEDMAKRLPITDGIKPFYVRNDNASGPNGLHFPDSNGRLHPLSKVDSVISDSQLKSPTKNITTTLIGDRNRCCDTSFKDQIDHVEHFRLMNTNEDDENGKKSWNSNTNGAGVAERIEKFEPGVYVTLTMLPDGSRKPKQVRFSSRREFEEHEEEAWWSENREKLYRRYNIIHESDMSSVLDEPINTSSEHRPP